MNTQLKLEGVQRNSHGYIFIIFFLLLTITPVVSLKPQLMAEGQEQDRGSLGEGPITNDVNLGGSISASSIVEGVRVAAVNLTSDKSITVTVIYYGNGTTPAITLLSSAVNLSPTQVGSILSGLMQNSISNGDGNNASSNSENITSINNGQLESTELLAGSTILEEGWNSPVSVSLPLQGNSTLYRSNFVSVQIFPLSTAFTENESE